MTIDKHCDQDGCFPGSHAEAHALIALEQSALYGAQLAIARWISSSAGPAPMRDAAAERTIWYAEAHHHFQEWLGRGGFAQYDTVYSEHFSPVMADFSKSAAPPLLANPVTDSGTSAADSCID